MARLLAVLGLLAVAFVAYTQVVAFGLTGGLDLLVARSLRDVTPPAVIPPFQAIAILGGIEITSLLAIGLAVYLVRRGFAVEALALVAFPASLLLGLLYKWLVHHPPPLAFAHADGPSVVTLFRGVTLALSGSYPSGHMVRTVLIYGLGAFVIRRLAPPGRMQRAAVPVAGVLVGVMALDRLVLGVHWQSDVVGGLLLGGVLLMGAIAWLDRPRSAA